MISTILSAIGVPLMGQILSGALSKLDDPAAKEAADMLTRLRLDPAREAEANAHARALAELEVAREGSALAAVNKTIQAEVASADPYVRRMRPTFGYLMAMTWAAQMFGLAYVIFVQPDRAGDVMAGMAHLTGIWGIGLSVLGIYVYKRSEEKRGGSRI